MNGVHGGVRALGGLGDVGAVRGDAEDAAAAGDDVAGIRGGSTGVKHLDALEGARGVEIGNGFTLGVRTRVTVGSHDDNQGGVVSPLDSSFVELARGGGEKQLGEITRHARHQNLALWITKSNVVLQKLHLAILGNHQTGKDDPGERAALRRHAVHGGLDNVSHHNLLNLRSHHRGWGVGTHTTSVQTGVAVAHALVILRARERHSLSAADDGEKRSLLAIQILLNHNLLPGATKHAPTEHIIHRLERIVQFHRHDDPFPRRQSIRLDDDWRPFRRNVRLCLRRVGKLCILRRGNVIFRTQILHKRLGPFQPRRTLARPEHRHPSRGQRVG